MGLGEVLWVKYTHVCVSIGKQLMHNTRPDVVWLRFHMHGINGVLRRVSLYKERMMVCYQQERTDISCQPVDAEMKNPRADRGAEALQAVRLLRSCLGFPEIL